MRFRTRFLVCGVTGVGLWLALSGAVVAETHVVVAKEYRFEPEEVTVKVGDTVRWENHEKRQYHSVYFEELGDPQGDYLFPGESRERTFDRAGTFPYICEPHVKSHNMKGVVLVVP